MREFIRSISSYLKRSTITLKHPGPNVDATLLIQGAINRYSTVIIPEHPDEWIVSSPPGIGPIGPDGNEWVARYALKLKSNFTLKINGTISAKSGSFLGVKDCVIGCIKIQNTTIDGTGTIKMQKEEYTTGEWRHCIQIRGSDNISISGINLNDSGGDGIYIGPTEIDLDRDRITCSNINIIDCTLNNNKRQGISVLSAVNLKITRCKIYKTKGTAPQAAIDLEPEIPKDKLVNIRITDCLMQENDGSGILIIMAKHPIDEPISVFIENCHIIKSKQPAFRFKLFEGKGPQTGTINIQNCSAQEIRYAGIHAIWDLSRKVQLKFINCHLNKTAQLIGYDGQKPIELNLTGTETSQEGGIFFKINIADFTNRQIINVVSTSIKQNVRGLIALNSENSTSQTQPLLPNLTFSSP